MQAGNQEPAPRPAAGGGEGLTGRPRAAQAGGMRASHAAILATALLAASPGLAQSPNQSPAQGASPPGWPIPGKPPPAGPAPVPRGAAPPAGKPPPLEGQAPRSGTPSGKPPPLDPRDVPPPNSREVSAGGLAAMG